MFRAYCDFKPQYFKGGSQALSNAIADSILENGGSIRLIGADRMKHELMEQIEGYDKIDNIFRVHLKIYPGYRVI